MIWRRVLLGVLWILSIVLITVYGGTLSYILFFTITIIPLISFAYMLASAYFFKINQELVCRDLVSGEMSDYYFVLKNESLFAFSSLRVNLFPDFFTVVDVPQQIEYELLPGEEFRFDTKLTCNYRGEYPVGVQYVVITDFLKIFKWRYKLLTTLKALVKPRVIVLENLKCMSDSLDPKIRENISGNDYPDVVVRDYQRGDSLRLIHWKATARENSLKTRTYYGESKQGIRIYYEKLRYSEKPAEYLPLENKILEIVLALSNFFVTKDVPVYVDERVVNNQRDFAAFYERLSKTVFAENYDSVKEREGFYMECIINPVQVAFFVVHELTMDIVTNTQKLSNEGIYVVIYLVTDEYDEELYSYSNSRRQIVFVGTEEELGGVL